MAEPKPNNLAAARAGVDRVRSEYADMAFKLVTYGFEVAKRRARTVLNGYPSESSRLASISEEIHRCFSELMWAVEAIDLLLSHTVTDTARPTSGSTAPTPEGERP